MYLMDSKKLLGIAKYQFKLILTANFALAVVLCLLTPFMFGIRYLDSYGSSFVLERFVSLIGVVLLTPLFMPEQDNNIVDLVLSKQTEHSTTIFLRLIMSLLFMSFCIVLMIVAMRFWNCEFETVRFLIGTIVTALFLGAIGLTFHAFTNNVVIGYLASISYYLLNFTLGSKLKMFYLFSLSANDLTPKYWIGGIAIILILLSLVWKYVAAKMR